MATVQVSREFYKEFLMGRQAFKPQDFGVPLDRERFDELMVDAFHNTFRDNLTFDELLLRPRLAAKFCDDVRYQHGFFDMPDDIILRAIMIRRKNPSH